MKRVNFAFCLILFCGVSLMAQNIKLEVSTGQPPDLVIGPGTEAQQVMSIIGGKGGNTTSGKAGTGSKILIQAGDGGDSSAGSKGDGGGIFIMPGLPGTGTGDGSGFPGRVGIGTLTPQQMLSVQGSMNVDQAGLNNGTLPTPGLTFGSGGGEGVASQRTGGGPGMNGLDLYTSGFRRISISSTGAVQVFGTLSKGGGSFKIDHPLDPENKYLSHSFVESPDMKNIYDGVTRLDANGEATVVLPEYFEALNQDFRYQLTSIGKPSPGIYIAEEIHNHQFKVSGGAPGAKVSWQVTGTRHDAFASAHRVVVEENKSLAERGKLLYPREQQMAADAMAARP